MGFEYLEVSAEARYWEDATVNGVDDFNGEFIPCRKDKLWCPIIRISDGQIVNWDKGKEADIHYKVCDAGEYWLLDENKKRVAKWGGDYVPDRFLSQNDDGYGDYIIMNVNSHGFIEDWITPEIEIGNSQCAWDLL